MTLAGAPRDGTCYSVVCSSILPRSGFIRRMGRVPPVGGWGELAHMSGLLYGAVDQHNLRRRKTLTTNHPPPRMGLLLLLTETFICVFLFAGVDFSGN